MSRDLLIKLTALDFMAVDLALYLNTHPCDDEALKKYNEIVCKANELRTEYQNEFGPLYSFRSLNNGSWDWIDDPWPWQSNFLSEARRGK